MRFNISPLRALVGALFLCVVTAGCSAGEAPVESGNLAPRQLATDLEGMPHRAWGVEGNGPTACGEHLVVWTKDGAAAHSLSTGALEWSRQDDYRIAFIECSADGSHVAVVGGAPSGEFTTVILESATGDEIGALYGNDNLVYFGDDFVVTSADATTWRFSTAGGRLQSVHDWIVPSKTTQVHSFGGLQLSPAEWCTTR